jgi:hypothetical protein
MSEGQGSASLDGVKIGLEWRGANLRFLLFHYRLLI